MTSKPVYHVVTVPLGVADFEGWAVYREDDGTGESDPYTGSESRFNEQPSRRYTDAGSPLSQEQAIEYAEDFAEDGGRVIVHGEPFEGKNGNTLLGPIIDNYEVE